MLKNAPVQIVDAGLADTGTVNPADRVSIRLRMSQCIVFIRFVTGVVV
jgi:hypothetical protein